MIVRRAGMGSWLTDNIGSWIGDGIKIATARYGVPPAGTVITTPGGQVVRQGSGYPVTPGGAYYPPAINTVPGGGVTVTPSAGLTPGLVWGLGAVAGLLVLSSWLDRKR